MPVAKVRQFYHDRGEEMFSRAGLFTRLFYSKYSQAKLERMLKEKIAEETDEGEATLGSEKLRTLLMVVLRNATTDSPWPLSNNPNAAFNDRDRPNCNLKLPLWQIVRASTAAPMYFPPERITLGGRPFLFVDGGVTIFNNPVLQLFAMATVDGYRLGWPAGEDQLLLVSIGTGLAPDANANLRPVNMHLYYQATHIPSALMAAASTQQDFLCRVHGKCLHGAPIDHEVHDLITGEDGGPSGIIRVLDPGSGSSVPVQKLFTYVRYNVDLTRRGLDSLGISDIRRRRRSSHGFRSAH